MLPKHEHLAAAAEAFARANPSVRGVLLVGSYARGEETDASDIDLLVRVTRSEDVSQDQVKKAFCSDLKAHGFHVQRVDPFVIDDRDLGARSLLRGRAAHMRFLEADTGVLVWGEDFRGLLTPPQRTQVLQRIHGHTVALLEDPQAIDERDVLLVAIGRMYAHTDKWPSKREAVEWENHAAVRVAWQRRAQGEGPVVEHGAYAEYVRTVSDELDTFVG